MLLQLPSVGPSSDAESSRQGENYRSVLICSAVIVIDDVICPFSGCGVNTPWFYPEISMWGDKLQGRG